MRGAARRRDVFSLRLAALDRPDVELARDREVEPATTAFQSPDRARTVEPPVRVQEDDARIVARSERRDLLGVVAPTIVAEGAIAKERQLTAVQPLLGRVGEIEDAADDASSPVEVNELPVAAVRLRLEVQPREHLVRVALRE